MSNANVAEEAISHRILAVQSLNEALSVPSKTKSERDARMGAALALAFQSSHLQDGLTEFLTMVRGCNLIALDDSLSTTESAFHVRVSFHSSLSISENISTNPTQAFGEDRHLATMSNRVNTSQWNCVSHRELNKAQFSLSSLKPLAMTSWEQNFFDILCRTVDCAYSRPVEAYTTFVLLYNAPSRWTHDEFQSFIDPNNSVAQILLAHFIAIQAVLTPILVLERVGFQGVDAPTATLGWIEGIYRNVPPGMRGHVEWPRQVSGYPFSRFMGQREIIYYE